MACTPANHVRFATTTAECSARSPYSDADSSESSNSTSTLQYVNSQLIAHGFARSSGLSLDGLSTDDSERVVKCLLGMLGQITSDMSQSEQFTTKLRTISYEHERLNTMYEESQSKLAAVEREINASQSRLSAANKALQNSEAAHKATTLDLQRTRSKLHEVRQTYAAELKRREKEAERMVDRWTKLSDSQMKIGAAGSGMGFKSTLANNAVSARDSEIQGKGNGMLEQALDEAEGARKELMEENAGLKNVILASANELARTVHSARQKVDDAEPEAVFFTMADLFPPSPIGQAKENFNSLLSSLQETIKHLSRDDDEASTTPQGAPPILQRQLPLLSASASDGNDRAPHSPHNLSSRRDQDTDHGKDSPPSSYSDQVQAIMRRAVGLEESAQEDDSQHSNDNQSDDSARASLDSDTSPVNVKALEETTKLNVRHKRVTIRSPRKKVPKVNAPARSPMKSSFAVGKCGSNSNKKLKSSIRKPVGVALSLSTSLGQPKLKVIPPFETEVIPSFASSSLLTSSSQNLIVSSAFVLPPPSPMASIPPQPDLLSPIKQPKASTSKLHVPTVSPPDVVLPDMNPSEAQPFPHSPHPYPVAKPKATNMIHAYSPARPSPLSRILMMAESPMASFSTSHRRESAVEDGRCETTGVGGMMLAGGRFDSAMSLEAELGLDDISSVDSSPLREKTVRNAIRSGKLKQSNAKTAKSPSKAKGKTRSSKPLRGEKENTAVGHQPGVTKLRGKISPVFGVAGGGDGGDKMPRKSQTAIKGGARRVPIGSADAAPIGPGWK